MKLAIKHICIVLCFIPCVIVGAENKKYANYVPKCSKIVESVAYSLLNKKGLITPAEIDDKIVINGTVKHDHRCDQQLNMAHTITFVISKNNSPSNEQIGTIKIDYKYVPNVFYIAKLRVDEKSRHLGFGSLLINVTKALAEKFTPLGPVKIELIPWADPYCMQSELKKYYQLFGFSKMEEDGRQRIYLPKKEANLLQEK